MAAESQITAPAERALRRRVRRTALLLAAVAAAFYFGFIILTLVRGAK
jgi:uncharacterized membrane protein (DUF485 family)